MRTRNWRFVLTGIFLLVVAAVLFTALSVLASQSTDPAMVIKLAGQATGVFGGIGVVLVIAGLVGKKQQ